MNLTTWLNVIAVAIAALKGVPGLPADVLGYIQVADDAITNAVAAVQKAQTGVDPTTLKPIDPVA